MARHPWFKTSDELEILVDKYFANVPIKKVYTENGTIEMPCLTITGLALALGFASRQSIYDYENKPEFAYIIKRARLRIENDAEAQLKCSPKGQAGVIFILKNLGWKDTVAQEITGAGGGAQEHKWTVEIIDAKNSDT